MKEKFCAVTLATIMAVNVFPTNIFKKAAHAASFVSNVKKIAKPIDGAGKVSTRGDFIGPSW